MTNIERIQKGLDQKGLLQIWDDLSSHTDYVRGLILTEAKHDCDNNSSLSWGKYLEVFKIGDKKVTADYATRYIKMTAEKVELGQISADNHRNSLNETEAELTLPDSASTQMELRGENALQKARNYNEVKQSTGKEEPSAGDIRSFNTAKKEATSTHEEMKKQKAIPVNNTLDPFTTEEEIDFEKWCIEEHNFDIMAEKPKQTRAIYALKDEKVTALFNKLPVWKKTYKEMAKLCHPDKGGDSNVMSMLTSFKELMDSLQQINTIIEYENKVEKLKTEYSLPK